MTLAPFHFANCNAKCPTPPAAPLISTVTLASSGTGRWFRGVTTLMALHGSCVTMRLQVRGSSFVPKTRAWRDPTLTAQVSLRWWRRSPGWDIKPRSRHARIASSMLFRARFS